MVRKGRMARKDLRPALPNGRRSRTPDEVLRSFRVTEAGASAVLAAVTRKRNSVLISSVGVRVGLSSWLDSEATLTKGKAVSRDRGAP